MIKIAPLYCGVAGKDLLNVKSWKNIYQDYTQFNLSRHF